MFFYSRNKEIMSSWRGLLTLVSDRLLLILAANEVIGSWTRLTFVSCAVKVTFMGEEMDPVAD